ncbi:set domain containing protein [Nannochloropsis gaditana]|uniref:Set domain containing protein n=1 Tax=Nannochloropsis gaditana TaxID=72520 RepID=W7THN2_9STRA|nr:set domain containing protein [Nannochloropsis gaditana]
MQLDAGVSSSGGTADESAVNKYDRFLKWLLDNGAHFPLLELREYESDVRGVHAKEALAGDQVVVEIPLRCLITVEMGKESDVGKAVLASNLPLDAPKHIFLMLFMLTDRRNPSSFFKPYYDILPSSLSNMPIFWTDEELAYLKGSHLLTQIEERKRAIEADYAAIADVAPSLPSICSVEEFKWARMCVCSRNFGLEVNRIRTAALVPYADMLNHQRPRETKWTFDNARQAFTITTLQPIAPGAQVYDSYGQKCNHRFLLNYGFAVENNREADNFCPNEVGLWQERARKGERERGTMG